MNKTLIYLAIPYTGMEEKSFEVSCKITADLIRAGNCVYSPIVHSHTLVVKTGKLPQNSLDFWLKQDLIMLEKCDIMFVVQLDRWENSRGVQVEIEFAEDHNIPIVYLPIVNSENEEGMVNEFCT